MYDKDKPLPYKLTDEDMGIYNVVSEYHGDADLKVYTDALAGFLNDNRYGTDDGKRATLDEPTFVQTWLPHLYNGNPGRINIDDSPAKAWAKCVAGSVYSPVDITRNGEVIFTVPPMMGKLNVVGAKDRRRSIFMLHEDLKNMVSRLPLSKVAQTDNLVAQAFIPKDESMHESDLRSTTNLKYLYVMDEIFTYYGYDSILPPEVMSYKPNVLPQGNKTNGTNTSRTVQASTNVPVQPVESCDDLFG